MGVAYVAAVPADAGALPFVEAGEELVEVLGALAGEHLGETVGPAAGRDGGEPGPDVFLKGGHSEARNACLFDCGINHARKVTGNVLEMNMPRFEMTEGIENALVLPESEVDAFFRERPVKGDCDRMGFKPELDKAGLCEHVCSKPDEELVTVSSNLRPVIGGLESFFRGE